MKVALIGDVALELMAPYFVEAGYEVYVPAGFAAWRQELLDPDSALNRFKPDVVFDVTAHDAALAEEVSGFFDERMRVLAAMPYSLSGIRAIVDELAWTLVASQRKVLCLDADNTLWRGVLAEDGRDALTPCAEFQRGLLELRAAGVLLVLASKNDPAAPFMRGDMPLADSHFAAMKVNWSPKCENIVEACRELNLGIDSVAFLDDNPCERAEMSSRLPAVAVAPWRGWGAGAGADAGAGANSGGAARLLLRRLREYFFSGAGATAEDKLRAADYASNAERVRALAGAASVADYLASLDLRVAPSLASATDLDRLAQMAGKTNQFNATTIRRGRGEFAALIADAQKRVFVFRASDRFGDQGLVCYVVADLASRRITDFVMSCRAMGRTLENFAYGYVAEALGYAPAIDFVPSAKNAPFKAFLDAGPTAATAFTISEGTAK